MVQSIDDSHNFCLTYNFRDKENLAVVSDHGVIEKLSKLTSTEDDMLRAKLALAIGNCCEWSSNRAMFGRCGAVAPLVTYRSSNDIDVHQTTTLALFQLSKDPWNCVTMHQNGVVSHLSRLIGRYFRLLMYMCDGVFVSNFRFR